MRLPPKPASPKVVVAPSSNKIELTRFQRFIRRMDSAGPKIVLERLKEEWQEPVSEDVDEEVCPAFKHLPETFADILPVGS